MHRLLDHPPRHQRPAQADRDTTEDAVERAELHHIRRRMADAALPGQRPRPVGAAFAKQNQGLLHRVAAGGMHLDQLLNHHFAEFKIGMNHRPGDEGTVELVVEHLVDQHRGRFGEYPQLHPRMLAAHGLQCRGQMQRGKGFHGTDTQLAGRLADLPDRGGRLLLQLQHPPRIVEQHPPRRCQFQPAALAQEEFGAQFLLQLADTTGDVGLHGIQFFRGRQNAAFLDHRLKGAQGNKLHTILHDRTNRSEQII